MSSSLSLDRVFPRLAVFATALLALALAAGCATRVPEEDGEIDEPVSRGGTLGPAEGVTGTAWAEMSAPPKAGELKPDDLKWEIFRVPGKQPASYSYVRHEGRDAVLAKVEASGSILRHRHRIEPDQLGLVRFSWNVPDAVVGTNLTLPQLEDVPVRVVLAFEGDRSKLSMKNSLLSELSRLLTGEEMPFATLVYSWSRVNQPGEVVVNDRTDRIRKIVVDSGDHGYNEWRSYERDIRADYRQAFGEDPGALLSFAVFTEGEKNEGQLQAFYGPLKLIPVSSASSASSASAIARK